MRVDSIKANVHGQGGVVSRQQKARALHTRAATALELPLVAAGIPECLDPSALPLYGSISIIRAKIGKKGAHSRQQKENRGARQTQCRQEEKEQRH
jgi:hypothetical protein